jgi:hypothetical protein
MEQVSRLLLRNVHLEKTSMDDSRIGVIINGATGRMATTGTYRFFWRLPPAEAVIEPKRSIRWPHQ